ncbi:olee1-like protein [Rutidosis leptorrhynchoides]|uniref:olee1-like protein n=1 Tax=Rutidosis leptorrhynchoides TaxID=125765 RepID=UPI003A9A4839
MVDYRARLVVLSILLLTATTARSSWMNGGAPSPSITEGDYVTSPDDLMNDDDAVSPGPSNIEGKKLIESHRKVLVSQEKDDNTFVIQGKVYCDPCRIQFPTKISYALAGTKVTLVCHKENGEESYKFEGESDQKGKYTLNAVGDHADEICEITVNESPDPNCPDIMDDENHVRVSLTNKHGAKGKGRYANPLGFMVKDVDPRCKEALDELGFTGV